MKQSKLFDENLDPEIVKIADRCGDYTPGRFAWLFSDNIQVLVNPIRTKGSLGLWNFEL